MNRLRYFLFSMVLLLSYSCGNTLESSISNPQKPLSENDFVLVLEADDAFENDGEQVGIMSVSGSRFSTYCSYTEVIGSLRKLARENGANVIRIIEHQQPTLTNSCHRITAEFYRVPDYRNHEIEIEWSSVRKLTWSDFKGTPKFSSDQSVGAVSYCAFGFQSNYVTLFSKARMVVKNTFVTHMSWVREDQERNRDLLEHEQLHFDLSELYARNLRREFANTDLNIANINSVADEIFDEVYEQYMEAQKLFDEATNHGRDVEAQKEWKRVIEEELWNLEDFRE